MAGRRHPMTPGPSVDGEVRTRTGRSIPIRLASIRAECASPSAGCARRSSVKTRALAHARRPDSRRTPADQIGSAHCCIRASQAICGSSDTSQICSIVCDTSGRDGAEVAAVADSCAGVIVWSHSATIVSTGSTASTSSAAQQTLYRTLADRCRRMTSKAQSNRPITAPCQKKSINAELRTRANALMSRSLPRAQASSLLPRRPPATSSNHPAHASRAP